MYSMLPAMETAKIKNGGHVKRGGLSNARLFVATRPLMLGTVSGCLGGTLNRIGCQSRFHPIIETIHFRDYSKSKRFDLLASMVGLDSVAEESKKPWNIGD